MPRELWPGEEGLRWRLVTDAVMGGMSQAGVSEETILGREAVRLRGRVSTENNGGFVQIALDLDAGGGILDARAFSGVTIDVWGNGEAYGAHLRTTAMWRPQQSYRQAFVATADWQSVRLPFADFTAHRIDLPLDTGRLRRIGLVAIGRQFDADLGIARLVFY